MKTLIVGAGSIGLRHAEILSQMKFECHFLSSRKDINYKTFGDFSKLDCDDYGYIILANESSKHFKTFLKIEEFFSKKIILIENPLFTELMEVKDLNNSLQLLQLVHHLHQ